MILLISSFSDIFIDTFSDNPDNKFTKQDILPVKHIHSPSNISSLILFLADICFFESNE
jgi:hypothetical protein